jgi:hypothetical protein
MRFRWERVDDREFEVYDHVQGSERAVKRSNPIAIVYDPDLAKRIVDNLNYFDNVHKSRGKETGEKMFQTRIY